MLSRSFRLARQFGLWTKVPTAPADSILGLNEAFKKATADNKVNLTVGAYRDENGNPWILPSVKEAIKEFEKSKYNLEYLPINGTFPPGTDSSVNRSHNRG